MTSNPKRKAGKDDREKLARRHQEDALDDALRNTFPASDPVSIEQPAPPETDDNLLMTVGPFRLRPDTARRMK
jgi:hypothetical protein